MSQEHTRAILCGNLQEKCRTRIPGMAFCMQIYRKKRTCTCHKSRFVWKFTRNMTDTCAGDRVNTSIEHRAFYCYRKNPSVWPHCLGKKNMAKQITWNIQQQNNISNMACLLENHEMTEKNCVLGLGFVKIFRKANPA